jgi:hypothetical protein
VIKKLQQSWIKVGLDITLRGIYETFVDEYFLDDEIDFDSLDEFVDVVSTEDSNELSSATDGSGQQLEASQTTATKSAGNLQDYFSEIMRGYGFSEEDMSKFAVVTDEGANIKNAFSGRGWFIYYCFSIIFLFIPMLLFQINTYPVYPMS